MTKQTASRVDFEAYCELIGAKITRTPNHENSCLEAQGKLDTGVEYRISARALEVATDGTYYARGQNWNAVSVDTHWGNVFSLFGKGSRAYAAREACSALLDTLFELCG